MATLPALPFASAAVAVGEASRVFANRAALIGPTMVDPVAVVWSDLPAVATGAGLTVATRQVTVLVWVSDLGGYKPQRGHVVESDAAVYVIRDIERHPHTGQYLLVMEV